MATTNYSWNLPTVGGSEDTWGTQLNANWSALDTLLGGVTNTEFEILDGATISTTELNYLSGATGNIQSQIDSIVSSGGANDSTITIAAGTGLTGGGSFTLNQASNATITLNASGGGFGDGQTWQNVTSSRSVGTTYTNSTGKAIVVNILPTISQIIQATVGGVTFTPASADINAVSGVAGNFIVPSGATYSISLGGGGVAEWYELR